MCDAEASLAGGNTGQEPASRDDLTRFLNQLGRGDPDAAATLMPHVYGELMAIAQSQLRRFQYEGEFLGRLQHPGSAQIFDSGQTDTENVLQPFFALELVRGVPITDYVRKHDLSAR